MSWSDRRLFVLSLLAVGACGFTPAYGPGGDAMALRGQVAIEDPTDKLAYDLVARLDERLGHAANPRWRLDHAITTDRIGVGNTDAHAVTR